MKDIRFITRKLFVKNLKLVLIALIIPIIILGSFSYSQLYSISKKQSLDTNIQVFNQTKELFEIMATDINSVVKVVAGDASTINKLGEITAEGMTKYENLIVIKSMLETLANIEMSTEYFDKVYYYNDFRTDFILSTSVGIVNEKSFNDYSWMEEFNSIKEQRLESSIYTRNAYSRTEEEITNITYILRIPVNRAEKTGAFIINLNMDYINKLINQLKNNQGITFSIWNNDQVLLSNEEGAVKQNISGMEMNTDTRDMVHQDRVYVYAKSRYNNWQYVLTIPLENIKENMKPVVSTSFFIVLFCIVIGIILSFLVTKRSNIPMKNIFNMIEKVQNGESVSLLKVPQNDAYGFLSRNIVFNFARAKELENNLIKKQLEVERLQYQALQAQLNPHFLFNSLDSMKWSAVSLTESANETSNMIEYLSELLKYSISNPFEMVSIEQEVDYCKNYIYLLKIKHKDRLDVQWEISNELLDYKIYKLMLQPLLENAVHHGFRNVGRKCKIKVKIQNKPENIKISVIDNGKGMPYNKLKRLREALENPEEAAYSHIGLFNIKKRLELVSGVQKDVLQINSKVNMGTCVYLYISYDRKRATESVSI